MKALILNSGMGRRMGALTSEQPKCMTEISARETILSRQLRLLGEAGVEEAVITTGYFDRELMDYCRSLRTELSISFVRNPRFAETNYIYSIYLARDQLRDDACEIGDRHGLQQHPAGPCDYGIEIQEATG